MFIKWKKPSLTNKIVKKRDSKDRYPSIYNFCLHFSKPGLTIFTVCLSIKKKRLKSGKIAYYFQNAKFVWFCFEKGQMSTLRLVYIRKKCTWRGIRDWKVSSSEGVCKQSLHWFRVERVEYELSVCSCLNL